MSLNPERIKQKIIKAISINPTEIEIKQTIKVGKDGYFEEEEKISKLKVTIYQGSNRSEIKVSSDNIGTSYSNKRYSMIADYTAGLETNPKNSVEFDCIEGHMKIISVYPQVINGVICGYECELERID
jgi:hypothetical protein